MASVADLLTEINAHGFEDTDLSIKVSAINYAIKSIARRKAWPFLETVVSLTFDGSNAAPSNTPSDLRAVMKIIDTGTGRRVRFRRTDDMEENYGSQLTTGGDPFFYYFEGTALKVWYVPSATQTLRLRYLRWPALVTSTSPESAILIPPDGHEAIVFRALMRLYYLEDDPELATPFGQLYEAAVAELVDSFERQQLDEPEYIHVVDDDDWYDDFWH